MRRLVVYQAIAHLGGRGMMLVVHLLLPILLGWDAFTRLMVPWVWLVLLVQPLCDAGLDPLVSRQVAQGDKAAVGRVLALRLALAGAGVVATLTLAVIGEFSFGTGLALAAWFVCLALSQTLIAMLRGQERMGYEAAILPGSRAGLLALLAIGYAAGWLTDTTAAMIFAAMGSLTLLIVALVAGHVSGWSNIRPRIDGLGTVARAAFPLLVITGAGMLYLRIDSVMLSMLLNDAAMAAYQPAKRLVEAAFALPSIFVIAVFPSLARSGSEAQASVWRYTWRMLTVGIGVSALLTAVGGTVLWYLYGDAGALSRRALYVLAFAVPLVFVGTLLTQYLVALGRQAEYAVVGVAALALNVCLNWWFIPLFGVTGAAATTVAIELFVVILSVWLVRRTVSPSRTTSTT